MGACFARWDVLMTMRGSMGSVHVVFDGEWKRLLAVKTVQLAQASAAWARFRGEGRTLVSLPSHRHVVPVLFFDEWRGTPYLAMECVASVYGIGTTLWSLLRRRVLSPEEIVTYACMMLDGLEHIHGHGVLHLDLHPGNCLLDSLGNVLLADFGIATLTGQAASGLGMLGYAPPEQLEAEVVDERTDIFAFGAVLFTMACRHAPVDTGGSRRPFAPARSDYPAEIAEIIGQCLQEDPTERPKNTADLLAKMGKEFEAVVGRQYKSAGAREPRFESQVNRAVSLGHLGERARARRRLLRLLDHGRNEDGIWYNLGNLWAADGNWGQAAESYERSLAIAPDDVSTLANLAYVLARQDKLTRALQVVDKALRLDPVDATALINKGFVLGLQEHHEDALACFEALLRVQPEHPDGLASKAIALTKLHRRQEARKCVQQLKTVEPQHPHLAEIEEELRE